MSDEANVNPPVNEGEQVNHEGGDKDLQARLEQLEKTNQRLLDESNSWKSKARDYESKLDEDHRKKLEAEGKTKELVEAERKARLNAEDRLNQMTETVLSKDLRYEAIKHAKDAHDIDMVLKVSEHKELLKLDQDSLKVSGVKEFVDAVRNSHPYLFSKSKLPETEVNRPGTPDVAGQKNVTQNYIAELKNCKTQKELDAVRRKYGRDAYA